MNEDQPMTAMKSLEQANRQQAIEAMKIKGTKQLTVIICDHKAGSYTIDDCEAVMMVTAQKNAVVRGTMSRFAFAGLLGVSRCLEMFMNFARGMGMAYPATRKEMQGCLRTALQIEGEKHDKGQDPGKAN